MNTPAPSYLDIQQRDVRPVDVWNNREWQLLCNLRVSIPAVVRSFNAEQQTVRVQIAIRENIIKALIPTWTDIDTSNQDYPVAMYGGGGMIVTFPIQAGDECLLMFSDACIDAWFQSGGTANPQLDRRRHDLSDAFALVGLRSLPRKLANYSTTSAQIRTDDGTTLVDVSPGSVVLHATTVTVTGDLVVMGGITSDGDATIDGRVFLDHVHTGITTGSGDSGPVL